MALITCPDCGKQFSDAAAACPNCGRPNTPPATKQKTGCATWGCLVLIILALGSGILDTATDGDSSSSKSTTAASEPFVSQSAAKEAVRQQLRDPESARFSDVYVHRRGDVAAVCGKVNAKNGFGGYTGDSYFFVIGSVAIVETDKNEGQFRDLFNAACTDAPAKPAKPTRKAASTS